MHARARHVGLVLERQREREREERSERVQVLVRRSEVSLRVCFLGCSAAAHDVIPVVSAGAFSLFLVGTSTASGR